MDRSINNAKGDSAESGKTTKNQVISEVLQVTNEFFPIPRRRDAG